MAKQNTDDKGYFSETPYLGFTYDDGHIVTGQKPQGNQSSPGDIQNPYKNLPYMQGNIWDTLGFSNTARTYNAQLDQAAQEWDSEYARYLEEREYNSEAAKAQRLKEAGVNPDLQGLGSGSEQSTGGVSQGVQKPVAQGSGGAAEFVNALTSIVSTFMQLGTASQAMRQSRIQSDIMEAELTDKVSDTAFKMFDNIGPTLDDFYEEKDKSLNIENLLGVDMPKTKAGKIDALKKKGFSPDLARAIADGAYIPEKYGRLVLGTQSSYEGLSPRMQRRLSRAYSAIIGNRRNYIRSYGSWNKDLDEYISNMITSGKFGEGYRTKHFYKSDTYEDDPLINGMADLVDSVSDLERELDKLIPESEKATAEAEASESRFNKDYYDNLSAEDAADAENTQARQASYYNDALGIVYKYAVKKMKKGGLHNILIGQSLLSNAPILIDAVKGIASFAGKAALRRIPGASAAGAASGAASRVARRR